MLRDALNWIRELIRGLPSGMDQLAEQRLVPPDGTYVMMPYTELEHHTVADRADRAGEAARAREEEERS